MSGTRALTEKEVVELINNLSSNRDKCLFLLGLKTGFRISELLSIQLKDVMQDNAVKDSITVFKRNTKGKVASRTIPLNKATQVVIQQYVNTLGEQTWLFESQKGNKLSRIQAWRIIKDASKGFKGKIATHSMRKTFASKVYQKLDKDIVKTQRAMGHKSINSTVAYIGIDQEEIDRIILEL